MSDLFDDAAPGENAPEFSVSEISGAVKKTIEGAFGRVRVRGEIGRVSRPASGHLYLDLKDDRAVMSAVVWKGTAQRLAHRPEEGIEVVATGRLTTFPGQSRYQMIIEDLQPAGQGALMAMLDARRKKLAAEGVFDEGLKQPLPYLPEVIGVVTSPSGAVIRDILHRLRDRFPRRVLVWPVTVQGEKCAPEVTAAIEGFNAIEPNGPVPRPDLLIVARGGGSIEDLWGFNEEIVVRAAAASRIPLISAVGHETDTTLIDFAADRRAPTPTAAAEMAVPVRADLLAHVAGFEERRRRAMARMLEVRGQRLRDLARGLPRPDAIVQERQQRFDIAAQRLAGALGLYLQKKRTSFVERRGRDLTPLLLRSAMVQRRDRLTSASAALRRGLARQVELSRARLDRIGLRPRGLDTAYRDGMRELARLSTALANAMSRGLADRKNALGGWDRMLRSLSYKATLQRGFAVVRGQAGEVLQTAQAARGVAALEIEFADGKIAATPKSAAASKPRPKESKTDDPQGQLF